MHGSVTNVTYYSVVVPTYNERENIAVLTFLLLKALAGIASFELIVVDDASPDGTQDVVRQLQHAYKDQLDIKLVARPGKLGLGTAYAAGVAVSSGDFIVLMDADLSHLPAYLPAFLEKQRSTGADIVTGTRYVPGGGVSGWDWRRKLTSRGANLLARFLLQARASDLTGSFRMYKRGALTALLNSTRSRGYAFQMEVIVRAQYEGFSIAEVPIVFVDRLYGQSKLGASEYMLFVRGLLRLLLTL